MARPSFPRHPRLVRAFCSLPLLLAAAGPVAAQDADGDGVLDPDDNCLEVANGPQSASGACDAQEDADGDGYGNACDSDANGNGGTDASDLGTAVSAFVAGSADPLLDLNCNGAVDASDLGRVVSDFSNGISPGPSGLACAGTPPCPAGAIGPPLPSQLYHVVADSPSQVSGRVTPCAFSTPGTSPSLCEQHVLVFPLLANPETDPPLAELAVTPVGAAGAPDHGAWTAAGLDPDTVYAFRARNRAPAALPDAVAIGSPWHHATPGAPLTLPDGGAGFALAGASEVTTRVSDRGTARIELPLRLPPGTAGMRPALGLAYDSHGRNGLVGLGWMLEGLSSIARCTATVGRDGFVDPVDFDGNDRFCWDGERLVPASPGAYWAGDGSEYRTEVGSLARVVANGTVGDGPASFTVWTPDGRILTFAEQGLREPSQGAGVHTWALSRVEDRDGNYYTVEYHRDVELGELWPVGVDYTGKDGASPSAPYAGVDLVYESRPDPIDGHRGAVRRRLPERLARIETFTEGETVTTYWLEYDGNPNAPSRLTTVTECGHDDLGRPHCLAPTRFDWEAAEPIAALTHATPAGAPDTFYPPVLGDLDGDGTLDLAIQDDVASETLVHLSPGLALAQPATPSPDLAIPHAILFGHTGNPSSWAALRPGDFDGGGRHGLVSWDRATGELRLFDRVSSAAPTQSDGFTGLHLGSELHVRDFTGDGSDDLLLWNPSLGELVIYPVVGGDIDLASPTTALAGFEVSDDYGDGSFNLTRLLLGDFNGDGVTDLLLVAWREPVPPSSDVYADGAIYLVENGVVGTPVGLVPNLWNAGPSNVGDFNGDGTSDLVSLTSTHALIRLVANGHVASEVSSAWPMPLLPVPIPGDFDGDGTDDLLVFSPDSSGSTFHAVRNGVLEPASALADTHGAFLDEKLVADLTGNGLPDLLLHDGTSSLVEVTGRAGDRILAVRGGLVGSPPPGGGDAVGTRSFAYAPRSDASLYATAGGLPASFFGGGAAYLVASASVETPAGAHRLDYAYAGEAWDPLRREALGLRSWRGTDAATGRSTHRLLRQDLPFAGLVEREEHAVSTGQVIARTDNVWATAAVSGAPVPLVHLEKSVVSAWELGEADPYQVVTSEVLDLDAWGNVTGERTISDDGWDTRTVRTFTNDPDAWLVGLVDSEAVTDANLVLGLSESRVSSVQERDPATGRPLRVEAEPGEPFALATAFAYDDWGNRVGVTVDPDGQHGPPRTTTTERDARGRLPTRTTNPLGHQTTLAYDPRHGGMRSTSDPNGVSTLWTFDAVGRRTSSASAGSIATTTVYGACLGSCPPGAALATLEARTDGSISIVHLDALGREQRTERVGFDGAPVYTDRSYDLAGRLASLSLPTYAGDAPPVTTFTYDPAGRLGTVAAPGPALTTFAFSGRSVASTRSSGSLSQTTTRVSDSRGNLVGVVDAAQGVSIYTYGPFDRPDSITGPDGPATTIRYRYTARGRTIEIDDPNSAPSTRQLDAFGRTALVSRIVGAAAEEVVFAYDALDRLTARTEAEGTTTWTWDSAPNGIGAVHSVAGPDHVVTSGYDLHGRVAQVDEEIFGTSHSRQIEYDSLGRIRVRGYPTGLRITDVYDSRGYLERVVDDEGVVLWTGEALYADGNLARTRLGNGIVTHFDRDPETRRLEAIRAGLESGSEVLDLGIEWDDLGRLDHRTDRNRTLSGGGTFLEQFEHDALDRLTSSATTGGTPVALSYSPGGRIEAKSDVGSYHYGEGGAGPDQLTSLSGWTNASFTHDQKGNLESTLGRNVAYSSFDKPTFISNASVAISFAYGVDRRRVRQVEAVAGQPTATTTYVGERFEERRIAGTSEIESRHYVIVGGVRVASIVTDALATRTRRYLHQDHLGSVAAMTDAQGGLVSRYYYDAFGQAVDETGQPLSPGQRGDDSPRAFTDHEYLDEAGLIHANGRVLDPFLGRFLSIDPVVGHDVPQSISPYSYVRNRPLALVDPTGLWGVSGEIFNALELAASFGVPAEKQPDCSFECRMEDAKGYLDSAGGNTMSRWSGDARLASLHAAGVRRAIVDSIADTIPPELRAAIADGLKEFQAFVEANGAATLTLSGAFNKRLGLGAAISISSDFRFENFTVTYSLGYGIGAGMSITAASGLGGDEGVGLALIGTIATGVPRIGAFGGVRVSQVGLSVSGGLGIGNGTGVVFGPSGPGFRATRQELEGLFK